MNKSKASPVVAEESQESRYKLWRRYVPLLYEFVSTQVLDWPSSCVEILDLESGGWLDILQDVEWRSGSRLILAGTYSGNCKEDTLELFISDIPPPWNDQYDASAGNEQIAANSRVRTTKLASVPHEDEVLSARAMPQRNTLIASRSSSMLYLYDFRTAFPSPTPVPLSHIPGLCIGWSPTTEGSLLIGGEDGVITHMRVDLSNSTAPVQPLDRFAGPKDTLMCVEWHPSDPTRFVSGSQDGLLSFWDTRNKAASSSVKDAHGPMYGVNCASHCPTGPNLVLSGVGWRENASKEMNTPSIPEVKLWDVRKLDSGPVHIFASPTSHALQDDLGSQVYQVRWNPLKEKQFGSCAGDGTIRIWDQSKIGATVEKDSMDGPAELVFVHGGHTDAVSDFQWDRTFLNTCVSVADDNICMLWRPLVN